VNDYILTNDWKGPYFGYLNVIKTFERTDRPRRVDPIDVYFHFYAGERESSLNALKQVLVWVSAQNIAPMFSSGFVKVEQGYISAHIQKEGAGANNGWVIEDYGKDTTVRFDHADKFYPEISSGVIGFRHRMGCLYVYLAPDQRKATIKLWKKPPLGPWLSRATGYVRLYGPVSRRVFSFSYNGWIANDRVIWKGLYPSTSYRLSRQSPRGERKDNVFLMSDKQGMLSVDHIENGVRYSLSVGR
jgi:hypothetical protein